MASNTQTPYSSKFSVTIKEIYLYKFDAIRAGGDISKPDPKRSVNIFNVAKEVSIYEDLFSPTMKCDISLLDSIGLFNNFPLIGEEIVRITYKDVSNNENEWFFIVRNIANITIQPQNKGLSYIMECEAIEVLANDLMRVQTCFMETPKTMIENLWEEYIIENMNKIVNGWGKTGHFSKFSQIDVDINEENFAFVVPNLHVFDSISMIKDIAIGQNGDTTFLFYQNNRGFHVKSLQTLFDKEKKQIALNDKERIYRFLSNEIPGRIENRERIISELYVNNRGNSSIRIKEGYFNSNLLEVNPHQKAMHTTGSVWNFWNIFGGEKITTSDGLQSRTSRKIFKQLARYNSNTEAFNEFTDSILKQDETGNDEIETSNSTSYLFTVFPESDAAFPLRRYRDRMNIDKRIISSLKNIDLTVVIPGTIEFCVGDLFNLQMEEIHGFTDVKIDAHISGLFLITEVKHVLHTSGFHSTTLRLNKDGYDAAIDVDVKYGFN